MRLFELIKESWGTKPTVFHDPDFAKLVPGSAQLLRTPLLRPPFLTVLQDGKQLPASRYCRAESIVDFAPPEMILDLEALSRHGASVKLNRMELWSPPIAALATAIGAACGKQVKVWGFVSPHAQMLVPAHRDPAHVVAVQIEGSKRWNLGGPCPEGSWSAMQHPVPTEETIVELAAGDVLYLPYGYAHCAAAETASSFHISFALEGTTAGELRQRVVKHLLDNLDGKDATEVRPENVSSIVAGLAETMAAVTARAALLATRDLAAVYAGQSAGAVDSLLRENGVAQRDQEPHREDHPQAADRP